MFVNFGAYGLKNANFHHARHDTNGAHVGAYGVSDTTIYPLKRNKWRNSMQLSRDHQAMVNSVAALMHQVLEDSFDAELSDGVPSPKSRANIANAIRNFGKDLDSFCTARGLRSRLTVTEK